MSVHDSPSGDEIRPAATHSVRCAGPDFPDAARLICCIAAEPFEPRWERPGATPDEAEQQLSRCRYDVGMNAANLESSKVMDLIDDCMKKEGYRWVTE